MIIYYSCHFLLPNANRVRKIRFIGRFCEYRANYDKKIIQYNT